MAALDRLLDRIGDPHDASKPRPMVTLDEFFAGNDDAESLGKAASCRVAPAEFYTVLRTQLAVDGWHDIRVEILPETTASGWPRMNTVWVVSSFDRREIVSSLIPEFWDGFLPMDWLSFPRVDGVELESMTIPENSVVFGFDYPDATVA